MSSLPPGHPAARYPAGHPARIMLDSPLAAASRSIVYRRRNRQRPRERGLRLAAAVGSLLLHVLFLLSFVLGPAYVVTQRPEPKRQFMQIRLIEKPEPPPPPPVRGTPPKELGPRHQGRASQLAATRRQAPAVATAQAAMPQVPASAVRALPAQPRVPRRASIAAARPPSSVPPPTLPSIPLAEQPPTVKLAIPALLPPMPPKFQPEPVRKPQLEGNRPQLPPTSMTLTQVPAQTLPTVDIPVIPSNVAVPPVGAPRQLTPIRTQIAVAAPEPEQPPISLPAPPAPTVNLQVAPLKVPASGAPSDLPQLQATAIPASEAPPVPVPVPTVASAQVELHAPAVKIDAAAKLPTPAIQPPVAVELPPSSATAANVATAASVAVPPAAALPAAASPAPAKAEQSAAIGSPQQADSTRQSGARDVSTAPNATPLGSDSATPGEPNGVTAAAEPAAGHGTAQAPASASAQGSGKHASPGKVGGNQPGAVQGALHGASGGYVQLKPHGDTQIMDHGAPDIGYRPTRFDPDWTPDGESSVDTALRHAVEKTTIKHTFHLPRGVRVGCALHPLLPMALFSCGNPDPPPTPVAQKVYDQMDLPPARPLAPTTPASVAAPAAVTPIELDNSVECATARVAGGPLPPGCEGSPSIRPSIAPSRLPAASSSSWVPASDQFH
ncbi:MAG: hypothetical protein KGJ32_08995 [Xanthomonadaceae bacterium]|nr:hypothetical protein [Xanthomonadaceae bacterium]